MVTTPLLKKILLTTEKVTTSEEVNEGPKKMDDMKETVFPIRSKDPYNFEGQYKGSTGWFILDHELKKRKFSTLEPNFYIYFYEKDTEGQDMEPYITFLVPFDYTKLKLFYAQGFSKNREKEIASDNEEAPKNLKSSSDNKK